MATNDDGRFAGKVVLVTGAGSGIGEATAIRFGADGGTVVCVDLDGAAAERTAAAIREAGGNAGSLTCNVADEASVNDTVSAAVAANGRLDVLANVAGVGGFRRLEELELSEWDRIIGVNLTGTYLMCRAAIHHLLESQGAIVNVASIAGLKGQQFSAAYAASKGGVALLTRALANEFATRDVRINAVAPGGVWTPMIEQFALPEGADPNQALRMVPVRPKIGDPAEIAAAITWLASDDASYVMGTVLPVDGCTIG